MVNQDTKAIDKIIKKIENIMLTDNYYILDCHFQSLIYTLEVAKTNIELRAEKDKLIQGEILRQIKQGE